MRDSGFVAARVLRRASQKTLRSPSTWLIFAASAALLVVSGAFAPMRSALQLSSSASDAADRYVESLQTGNAEALIGALAPEARTQLSVVGRIAGAPRSQAERLAAERVLEHERIDRFTRLGQHRSADGTFVVYAVERDTDERTHAWPLIVWLDSEGRVLRTTP